MYICRTCLTEMKPIPSLFFNGVEFEELEPSFPVCCESPDPYEIEEGEIDSYREAFENGEIDLKDLSEKEEIILRFLRHNDNDDKQMEFEFE